MKAVRYACLLCLGLLLSCSTELTRVNDRKIDANNNRASELSEQLKDGQARVRSESRAGIERIEGIWLPFKRLSEISEQASARSAANRRITVNRDFRNIQEVAERVTMLTGIPVNVAPDALVSFPGVAAVPTTTTTANTAAQSANNPANVAVPPLPPIAGGVPPAPVSVQMPPPPVPVMVPLSYDGALAGFLDVAAARFGVSWEWSHNAINMFRYTTRTFRLTALPGDSTMQSVISSTSGGSGGGGSGSGGGGATVGGTSSSGINITGLSVWTAVQDAIKGMLTQRGTVSVNAATGTVMVTDTPQVLSRVASFIEQQNASLSKQVLLNVRVLAVDLSQEDSYGINWSAIYTTLSKNYRFALIGPTFATPQSGDLAAFGFTALDSSNAWGGSSAFIRALSTQGKVSQLTSTSLITLNNQPAPLQVGTQTAYLASVATTLTSGFGATTTLTPGTFTEGFSMSVVPHILDKGKLMLQFAINISSLAQLNTVESGSGANLSRIQTPSLNTRHFLQRVMLQSGDTLVLTGFEQDKLQNDRTGVGTPRNTALGGGVHGKGNKTTLVILIQPLVSEQT